jgi:hypothetical protein
LIGRELIDFSALPHFDVAEARQYKKELKYRVWGGSLLPLHLRGQRKN